MNESSLPIPNHLEVGVAPEQQRERLVMAGQIATGWTAAFNQAEGHISEDPILSILASEIQKLSVAIERTREMSETNISDLLDDSVPGMYAGTVNVLRRQGINTIGDLLPLSYADLRHIRNMNSRLYTGLKEKLKSLGIVLREE